MTNLTMPEKKITERQMMNNRLTRINKVKDVEKMVKSLQIEQKGKQ